MATLSQEKIDKYRTMYGETTNQATKDMIAAKLKEAGVPLEEPKPNKVEKEPKKVEKKSEPKKAAPKKPEEKPVVSKKAFIVDGKAVSESDVDFCDKIMKAWRKRRALAKEAGAKYKTKSVMRIVTEKVADAVEKTIKNNSTADIKKNPKAFVKKVERVEASAKAFLNSLEDLLGEDFDKSEITKEFAGLDKDIKAMISKIASKR